MYKVIPRSPTQINQEQHLGMFIFNLSSLTHHVPFGPSFYTYIPASKCFRQDFQRLVCKIVGKNINVNREDEANEQEIRPNVSESVNKHCMLNCKYVRNILDYLNVYSLIRCELFGMMRQFLPNRFLSLTNYAVLRVSLD